MPDNVFIRVKRGLGPLAKGGTTMIGAFIAKKKVSSAFDALNWRDFSTFLSAWREDCAFIYPGDISVSGKMEGKASIEKWFQNFMDQFPKIKFTLKNICVENIFDFVGTNVVTVHWNVDLTNLDEKVEKFVVFWANAYYEPSPCL